MGFAWATKITSGSVIGNQNEIKTNLDSLYSDLGLTPYTFSHSPLHSGDKIKSETFQEFRDATDHVDTMNYCRSHNSSYESEEHASKNVLHDAGDNTVLYSSKNITVDSSDNGSHLSGENTGHDNTLNTSVLSNENTLHDNLDDATHLDGERTGHDNNLHGSYLATKNTTVYSGKHSTVYSTYDSGYDSTDRYGHDSTRDKDHMSTDYGSVNDPYLGDVHGYYTV